jgi:hypothetical protein
MNGTAVASPELSRPWVPGLKDLSFPCVLDIPYGSMDLWLFTNKNGDLSNKGGASVGLNGVSNMASWEIPELNGGSNGTNLRIK